MILYLSHTRVAIVLYSCYICGWFFLGVNLCLVTFVILCRFCLLSWSYFCHICVNLCCFCYICMYYFYYVCLFLCFLCYICVIYSVLFLLIISVCSLSFQELEITLEEERRSGDDARSAVTLLERKRIALQTELEDVRALLETVSIWCFNEQ